MHTYLKPNTRDSTREARGAIGSLRQTQSSLEWVETNTELKRILSFHLSGAQTHDL